MKIAAKIFAVLLAALACSSCSGGGGGSSDGSGGDSVNAATGARVLHGSLTLPEVSLQAGAESLQSARFMEMTYYRSLGTGLNALSVSLSRRPEAVVGSVTVALEKNERRSILVCQSRSGNIVAATSGPGEPSSSEEALIQIAHSVWGASRLTLSVDGAEILVSDYCTSSASIPLAAGVHRFVLKRASDGSIVASFEGAISPGRSYVLWAGGEVGYYVPTRLLEE